MKHVNKSVLLEYSAAEMFQLVLDVQAYPQFLPWCERGEVLEQGQATTLARLHMAFAGLRHSFSTRNTWLSQRQLLMHLVDGPFSMLEGRWDFRPLAGAAADLPACRVDFDLRYAFSSRPLELVLSPVFDKVANTLVDAFVRRAGQVYGER